MELLHYKFLIRIDENFSMLASLTYVKKGNKKNPKQNNTNKPKASDFLTAATISSGKCSTDCIAYQMR